MTGLKDVKQMPHILLDHADKWNSVMEGEVTWLD
jgi:hypothetical protein